MTSNSHLSTRSVPFRYVFGALALTLAALVAMAITPLGSVLTTATAAVVMKSMMLGWLALALVVDVKGWNGYSRSRRHFAFAVWFALGTATLSGFLVG